MSDVMAELIRERNAALAEVRRLQRRTASLEQTETVLRSEVRNMQSGFDVFESVVVERDETRALLHAQSDSCDDLSDEVERLREKLAAIAALADDLQAEDDTTRWGEHGKSAAARRIRAILADHADPFANEAF